MEVTYYLRRPETRPNPFRLGPRVIFVDGKVTLSIEPENIPDVDHFMSSYNATREISNGGVQVHEDRDVTDGQGEVLGGDEPQTDLAEDVSDDRGADGDPEAGGAGGSPDEGHGQGAEDAALIPVERRTKKEINAGLTPIQAAEFRASGQKDPEAWFRVTYPEEYNLLIQDRGDPLA
jgi:hypothetical protein